MGKYIYIIALLILIVVSGNSTFASTSNHTNANASVATEKIMKLGTPWAGSKNAASLSFYNFHNKIGKAYLGYSHSNGGYHRFQEPETSNNYGFYTDGYIKLEKWKLYGNFSYNNISSKQVNWVDVIEPYNDNPYTIGDSIGGNYNKLYFNMQGKGAYKISSLVTFGFDVKYKAGVGTKRKDPRPVNKITSFDLCPGLIIGAGKFKTGANLRYQGGKEDIDFETVTGNTYDLFYFKGLGVFSSTTEDDSRYTSFNLYGAGLQFYYNTRLFENVTSANFNKKQTDIKRGATHPLQVALLDAYYTEINSIFLFSQPGLKINRLKLYFMQKKVYGEEPVIEPKDEAVTYQWSTVAKYTLYWNDEIQYGFDYSYYKLKNINHINWGVNFAGEITSNETTYYFVPEYNKQKLSFFRLDAKFEKGFMIKKGDIVLSGNGAYKNTFDGTLGLVSDESLLETVNTSFVYHDFDYYNSGAWQLGASVKIGRDISIYKSPMQVYIDTGYKIQISDLPGKPKWEIAEIKLGMNF